MDKKVLYALTTKIFSALKKLGIKPKIGVTTDIQRLPGLNSFNADLSKLGEATPESLKKLITIDADFLAKATPDELRQYYNNLEYLQSTYPSTFSKAEAVTEAKTGIKSVVDDTVPSPTSSGWVNQERNRIMELSNYMDEQEKIYGKPNANNKFGLGQMRKNIKKQLDLLDQAELQGINYDTYETARRGLFRSNISSSQYRAREFGKPIEDLEVFTKDINKQLEGKASMETVNPKTGEVTSPKEPVKTLDEAEMIKQKYGKIIDDDLLQKILVDDDPQRKAEVLATIDEALKMQNKGIGPDEIMDIIKNTPRTKQAKGGLIKGISYKSMFSDLDRTLDKGLGTMFKKRKR
jgi:hypothetical protein